MGLNDAYDAVRDALLMMDPLPTPKKAYSMTASVETQRNVHVAISDGQNIALLSKTSGMGRGGGNKKRIDKRGRHCDKCDEDGHTEETCFKIHGEPDWFRALKEKKSAGNFNVNRNMNYRQSANTVLDTPMDFSGEAGTSTSNLGSNNSAIAAIIRQEMEKYFKDMTSQGSGHANLATDCSSDFADGDDGMKGGDCFNRAESSQLNDTSKSLVLVNYFMSVPIKLVTCVQNSDGLADMLQTCHAAAGGRWANFVAVDYYKRSEGGGTFQATDILNGELLCGCKDVHS